MTTAGSDWFNVVQSVNQYVSSNGWSWQETIWGGDDIEGSWDQFACPCPGESWQQTQYFINGWTSAEVKSSFKPYFVDYGDAAYYSVTAQEAVYGACPNNSCEWSPSEFYQAAWAMGWDIPIPEIYYNSQASRWSNSAFYGGTAGAVQYYGALSECSGSDPVQEPNCGVARASDCENGPDTAVNALRNATNATFAQTNESNIQWQNDGRSAPGC